MSKRIFTFGEIMLRISPYNPGERIMQTNRFRIEPGGSESNVALCLAQLGHSVSFLTCLPDNPMRNLILRYLNQYNVDTSHIATKGNRVGTYWTEYGIGPRAPRVIYDRENSSFSHMNIDDFDWKVINKKAHWFHTSGITPSLSRDVCMNIFSILEEIDKKVRFSIDLNYRYKLWKWIKKNSRKKIHDIMEKICSRAYLITGNESDFQDSFGFCGSRPRDIDPYKKIASVLFDKITNLRYIAVSLRTSHSASENDWSGILFVRNNAKIDHFTGPYYRLGNIVDRVGTGDSFTAGIIHGVLQFRNNFQHTIDFATTLAALNHTVLGDASQFNQQDVESTLRTKGKGRIQR